MSHTLYRFFNNTGDLLYVGITAAPGERWKAHSKTQPWWDEVGHVTVEHYASRPDVLAAEREAIKDEHPRYNKVHNSTAAATPAGEVRWTCAACRFPVTQDGHLTLNYHEVHVHDREVAQWHEEHPCRHDDPDAGQLIGCWTAEEYETYPAYARWNAWHDDCHPWDEEGHFVVDVAELMTTDAVLAFTAALIDKPWATKTDWRSVVASVARRAA